MGIIGNKLKKFRLPNGLTSLLNSVATIATPLVVGAVSGAVAGYGIGVLAKYDFSLLEQTKETLQSVKNYAEVGIIPGIAAGVMVDLYILSRFYKKSKNN